MQVSVLVQKAKQTVNNGKDIYDQWRAFKALRTAAATQISTLTDADFEPFGMTKAQFLAAGDGVDALIAAFEANDTAILDIYG